MAILSSIAVLNCQFIEETRAFYQQLLQFVVVNKRESEGELVWLHIMHGDTTLMLQTVARQNTELSFAPDQNISLYFFVNNIKELHHLIKAKNTAVSEIKQTPYQLQEFSLLDPEGNKITIAQKS